MAKIKQYFAPIRRITESNTGAEAWTQAARRLGSLGTEEAGMLRQTGDLGKQMVEELKGLIPIYSDHVERGGGGMRVREPREPSQKTYQPSNAITADDIASGRFSADQNGVLTDESGIPASETGLSMTRAAASLFGRYQAMQDRVDAHNAAVAREQAAADQRAQATQALATAKQNAIVDKNVEADRQRMIAEGTGDIAGLSGAQKAGLTDQGYGSYSPLDQALAGDKDLKRLDAGAAAAGMSGDQVQDYLNSRYGSDVGGRLYKQYQTDQYNKQASATAKLTQSYTTLQGARGEKTTGSNATDYQAALDQAIPPPPPPDTYDPDHPPSPSIGAQIWGGIQAAAAGVGNAVVDAAMAVDSIGDGVVPAATPMFPSAQTAPATQPEPVQESQQ